MISLKRAVGELERLDEMCRTALVCLQGMVETQRHHAVEVGAAATRNHKSRLEEIERKLGDASEPDQVREVGCEYEGELREYHGRAAEYIDTLRQELASTARSLQEVVNAVVNRNDGPEEKLEQQLGRLKSLARTGDLDRVRKELPAAVSELMACVEQIRKEKQLVVAQLRDEIHTLHARVQKAEATAATDPVSGALNRRELEVRIGRAVAARETFCLVFLWLRNYKHLQRKNGHRAADEVAAAFSRRVIEASGAQNPVGRWSDDEFLVLVHAEKLEAIRFSKEAAAELSGAYLSAEARQTLNVQVSSGVVDHRTGEGAAELLRRVDQLLRALEGQAGARP